MSDQEHLESERKEEEPKQELGGELFRNNHDLIGVEGIIKSQKNEIEQKKVRLNEIMIIFQLELRI